MISKGYNFFLPQALKEKQNKSFFPIYIFLMGFLFLCSCIESEHEFNKLSTEVLPKTRIGIFLPINHEQENIRKKAVQYYNAAKLAVDDLRPLPIEIVLYETDGTRSTMKDKVESALSDNIHIAVGSTDAYETTILASYLRNKELILLTFVDQKKQLGSKIFNMGVGNINLSDQILEYSIDQGYKKFLIVEDKKEENSIHSNDLIKLIKEKNSVILDHLKVSETPDFLSKMQSFIIDFNISPEKEAIIILGTPEQDLIFVLASLKGLMGTEKGNRIQVIGLSSWALEHSISGEPALENAWFPFVNNQRFGEFSGRYHKLYGSKPTKTSAIAYDSIAAIGALVKNAKKLNALDPFTISSITNESGFLGVLGTFRLLKNGSSERLLGILESNTGGIKILKRPSDRF